MPQRQIKLRRGAADHRPRHRAHQRPGQQHRDQAEQHRQRRQQRRRGPHAEAGIMRAGKGFFLARGAKEQVPGQPQRIADRQRRTDGCQHRHQPGQSEQRDLGGFIEHQLLGNEPAQRRQPRHRSRCQRRHQRGDRHHLGQPAQPPDVARAALVLDDPRAHEQRRLERGMVEDMQHRRQRRQFQRETEQHHQQAQLADGGIGKDAFQIMPEQRHARAEHHRDQPDAADDHGVQFRPRQHRPQPRQQEHPGLHHRRRMQIGADRSGRGHRVRQPEMERELRRLGKAANQNQAKDHRIKRRGAHRIAALQYGGKVKRSGDQPQRHHAPDQRQPPAAGHRQRHARTLPAFRLVLPEPDQQEGRKAGQLPEHQQQQHIARNHNAQHRALKQHQTGKEPPGRFALVKVEMAKDHHQQPDAEDQARKHQSQRIDHQRQVQPQRRHPVPRRSRHRAADHRPGEHAQQYQAQRARPSGDSRMHHTRGCVENRNRQRGKKWQRHQHQ